MINDVSNDAPWMSKGLCRQSDPELWMSKSAHHQSEARAICLSPCPVQQKCLAYAIERQEHFGVWGGSTEKERRQIRRRQRERVLSERSALQRRDET